MKKELDSYDIIIGLSDFVEWSYCEDDQMWYEDAKEVLPQPVKESEIVTDIIFDIKVNHSACWGDNWEEVEEEKNGIEEFVSYVFGEDNGMDCTWNAVLFKTERQQVITDFNDYGLWGLESFIRKLKEQSYATEYFEDGDARKFIAWTNENNQTRFVVHSYRPDYEYLKTLFDITLDRNILVNKLENILNIWHETIYNAIKNQEKVLNKKATNPHGERSIAHFFPDINDNTEESKTTKKRNEYTAFGVTGGIAVMIAVFIHQLITRPVVVMMIIKKIFGWE